MWISMRKLRQCFGLKDLINRPYQNASRCLYVWRGEREGKPRGWKRLGVLAVRIQSRDLSSTEGRDMEHVRRAGVSLEEAQLISSPFPFHVFAPAERAGSCLCDSYCFLHPAYTKCFFFLKELKGYICKTFVLNKVCWMPILNVNI